MKNFSILMSMKKIIYLLLILITLTGILWIFISKLNNDITKTYSPHIYHDTKNIPHKKAALLLGTAKYAHGRENLFFNARIHAAYELFKSKKVDAIVVSGDNGNKNYDEPTDMKDDLVKLGVPEKFITLDYAGFSTLDSMIRSYEVFGLDDFVVVSQPFHIQRALYIAEQKKIKAIGYAAKDVQGFFGKKVLAREILARFKAFLDIHVLNTEAKFYGKKEKVIYRH